MNYKEAYDRLIQLQQDIKVLKVKLHDNSNLVQRKTSDLRSFLHSMNQEKKEVEALEGLSISGLIAKIAGTYDEKHQKESVDYLLAKMKYDEQTTALARLKEDMKRLHEEIRSLESEHRELKDHILVAYPEGTALSQEIETRKKELYFIRKELVEAVNAVENVTALAKGAEKKFESAKGWSTYDTFFGGGIIADMVKYSRLDEANQHMADINSASAVMSKELRDVDLAIEDRMEFISTGEKFMDIAFDNIFSDWSIMGKIENNLSRLDEFIKDLERISSMLRQKMNQIDRELAGL
jgi:predicted RNase H-like nuclease (RuvC/YqgF family)